MRIPKFQLSIKFILIILLSVFYITKIKPNKYFKMNNSPDTYRIAIIFGTRPEIIKLIPLIRILKSNKMFNCIIINTGQHKEMLNDILHSFNLNSYIDFNINAMTNNQSLSKLTSNIIAELSKIYSLINPNAVIVQGDTTSAYTASVCAFYQKIPVFHVEAGLRTHNLFSPFPEEFNRKSIDIISTLHFASTEWAANNLLKENINPDHIFVTGNTVVDSLFLTLNNTAPSEYLQKLINKSHNLCSFNKYSKIILLTCHRRENYNSISNILIAIFKLLKNYHDIVIIFPFHLNPNIKFAIKKKLPERIYNYIINQKTIKNNQYLHLNRFLLIPPLNYFDLIHLQSKSYFIMTDSGGIHEEGVSIGKPILILRNTTERPEAIESGCAILVGTSPINIYNYAEQLIKDNDLYNKMSQPKNVFGYGNSSKIISEIIENYLINQSLSNLNILNILKKSNLNYALNKYDRLVTINNQLKENDEFFDIIIVLTIWRRNNLEKQLIQVKRQSEIINKKVNLIVFQNSNYFDARSIIYKWKKEKLLPKNVVLTHIQSPIETGYYGRFLIPLTSSVKKNSFFIICDDDVIWGDRYFENMIRVVKSGSLATRNGRIVNWSFGSECPSCFSNRRQHICYDEDIEYDYGGHIWAGRIDWLRKAWNHIPISLENSEDFWISSVLKSFYNISTKIPKCPCPKDNNIISPDLCAVSEISAINHINAIIGNHSTGHNLRSQLIRKMANKYNYTRLIAIKPDYVSKIKKMYIIGDKHQLFNLSDYLWKGAMAWT